MFVPVLPRKMSALLRLAVKDSTACEADPAYRLSMGRWHDPTEKVCAVCMAGSVMAKTLSADPSLELLPENMEGNADQLRAIDFMRDGTFHTAYNRLGGQPLLNREQVEALDEAGDLVGRGFSTNLQRAPWAAYLEAADILEAAGF